MAPLIPAHTIHVYTDGSASHGTAAWALVIVTQEVHSPIRFKKIGFTGGVLDDTLGPFVPQALDAEATAVIAMCEILLALQLPPQSHVICHCDNTAAGGGAFGLQNIATQHGDQSARQKLARIMVQLLQRLHQITVRHVHAHERNPWNEFADDLANRIRVGWQLTVPFKHPAENLACHPLAAWAWLLIRPDHVLPHLATILANQPPKSESCPCDPTLALPLEVSTIKDVAIDLIFGTVNVGTLDYRSEDYQHHSSCKTRELLWQCEVKGIAVVAIQESRARVSQMKIEGDWVRLIAAADRGQGGAEIWRHLPTFQKHVPDTIQPAKDISVWHQDHRVLAARFSFGGICFDVCSVYAPQKSLADMDIRNWRHSLGRILHQQPSSAHLFVLGDMNCSVGSVVTDHAHDHQPDFEDVGGTELRQLTEKFDLLLPATFAEWHRGSAYTFESSRGGQTRIDFIAVPSAVAAGIKASYVLQDLEVLSGVQDRRLTCLHMQLRQQTTRIGGLQKKSLYDRHAAKLNP